MIVARTFYMCAAIVFVFFMHRLTENHQSEFENRYKTHIWHKQRVDAHRFCGVFWEVFLSIFKIIKREFVKMQQKYSTSTRQHADVFCCAFRWNAAVGCGGIKITFFNFLSKYKGIKYLTVLSFLNFLGTSIRRLNLKPLKCIIKKKMIISAREALNIAAGIFPFQLRYFFYFNLWWMKIIHFFWNFVTNFQSDKKIT